MGKQEYAEAEIRPTIHLQPRYFRLYTDVGVEQAEQNYRYRELDWNIPLKKIALVCLDVWNYHFSSDTMKRVEDITTTAIKRCCGT